MANLFKDYFLKIIIVVVCVYVSACGMMKDASSETDS